MRDKQLTSTRTRERDTDANTNSMDETVVTSVLKVAPDRLELIETLKQVANAVTELEAENLRRIGKYQIIRVISNSAQATTFQGFDSELDRNVLLKLYNCRSLVSDKALAVQEGRLLSQVNSPFVAGCFGIEWLEDQPVLVLEYVEGQTILDYRLQNAVSSKQLESLADKIAAGMQAIHDKGIVHKDLKSSNVMIDADGNPRIVDFGLSFQTDADQLIPGAGTIEYLAPELARGDAVADFRSDVFGLGAILHELMLGFAPFEGSDRVEAVRRAQAGQLRMPSRPAGEYSKLLWNLCRDCLQTDPDKRPTCHQIRRRINRRSELFSGYACAFVLLIALSIMFVNWKNNTSAMTGAPGPIAKLHASPTSMSGVNALMPIAYLKDLDKFRRLAPLITNGQFSQDNVCSPDFRKDNVGFVHIENSRLDLNGRVVLTLGEQFNYELKFDRDCCFAVYLVRVNDNHTVDFERLSGGGPAGYIEHISGLGPTKFKSLVTPGIGVEMIYVLVSGESWMFAGPGKDLSRINRGVGPSGWVHEFVIPINVQEEGTTEAGDEENRQLAKSAFQKALEHGKKQQSELKLQALRSAIRFMDLIPRNKLDRADLDFVSGCYEAQVVELRKTERYRDLTPLLEQFLDFLETRAANGTDPRDRVLREHQRIVKIVNSLSGTELEKFMAADRELLDLFSPGDVSNSDRVVRLGVLSDVFALLLGSENEYSLSALTAQANAQARVANSEDRVHRKSFAECLRMAEVLYGPMHPRYGSCSYDYGEAELARMKIGNAAFHFKKAAEVFSAHPDFGTYLQRELNSRVKHSYCLIHTGNSTAAKEVLETGLLSLHSSPLELDIEKAKLLQNLAQTGDLNFAIEKLEEACQLFSNELGHNDQQTAKAYLDLAMTFFQRGLETKDTNRKLPDTYYARKHIEDHFDVLKLNKESNEYEFARALFLQILINDRLHGDLSALANHWREFKAIATDSSDRRILEPLQYIDSMVRSRLGESPAETIARCEKYLSDSSRNHESVPDGVDIGIHSLLADCYQKIAIDEPDLMERRALIIKAAENQQKVLEAGLHYFESRAAESTDAVAVDDLGQVWLYFGRYLELLDPGHSDDIQQAFEWSLRIQDRFRRQLSNHHRSVDDAEESLYWQLRRQLSTKFIDAIYSDKLNDHAVRELNRLSEEIDRIGLEQKGGIVHDSANHPVERFAKFAQQLPRDTAYISIFVSMRKKGTNEVDPHYEAFVVKSRDDTYSVNWVELGRCGPINEMIAAWQSVPSMELGNQLRTATWDKIYLALSDSGESSDCDRVLVCGAGGFGKLAFGSLPQTGSNETSPDYLIEKFSFRFLPHWQSALKSSEPKQEKKPGFGVVSGLDFGPSKGHWAWQELPGSVNEAETLERIASSANLNFQRLDGLNATRESLKELCAFENIHIATHSHYVRLPDFSNGRNLLAVRNPGLFAWLALSDANSHASNVLTLDDIMQLDFDGTKLVVLPSCNSAEGVVDPAGSTFCIANAISYLGARSVIGSLGMVDDQVCHEVFERFYRNSFEQKMAPAEALRAVQLSVLKGDIPLPGISNSRDPKALKFWANWVLISDGRNLFEPE